MSNRGICSGIFRNKRRFFSFFASIFARDDFSMIFFFFFLFSDESGSFFFFGGWGQRNETVKKLRYVFPLNAPFETASSKKEKRKRISLFVSL